jgi:hypothetical protein
MKRILLLAVIALSTSSTTFSQDLAYKLPEKPFTVASLRGEQLFQLSSVSDFDKSSWGVKLLRKLSEEYGNAYNSFGDLGINLNSNIYYYYQYTDSINYSGFIIPLSDVKKIDSMFGKTMPAMEGNGFRFTIPDKKSIISWNGQMLFILSGKLNHGYFEDSATAARYGIKVSAQKSYEDYYKAEVDTVTSYYEEPVDSVSAEDIAMAPPPPVYVAPEEPMDTDQAYEEKEAIKDSLLVRWLSGYTQQTFDKKEGAPSVLNNPTYQHSMDKNALATFWMSDMQSMYNSFMPYTLIRYGSIAQGYGSFISRLYMDKDVIRIKSELGVDKEKADVYKALTANKLNKKFLKYINSDSLIGFMSYAINTEAYLKSIPKMFKGVYGVYDEEMEMATDFISLLLDEKAIARVVKGDALFILSGLTQKEISFKSYAYDEETFQYKDSMMTKTETSPDFLCMFSSDDTQFIERMLKYGIKKDLISLNEGIYSIQKMYKSPFVMHLLIKDGIVFLGTSIDEIRHINKGTFKAAVDKQQKELLLKNNMSLFFNPKNLGNQLPERELGDMVISLKALLGGAGNVYLNSAGIRDGYISMDLSADVPKDKENALKYFVDIVSQLEKLK